MNVKEAAYSGLFCNFVATSECFLSLHDSFTLKNIYL